jgi:hypothetical protein
MRLCGEPEKVLETDACWRHAHCRAWCSAARAAVKLECLNASCIAYGIVQSGIPGVGWARCDGVAAWQSKAHLPIKSPSSCRVSMRDCALRWRHRLASNRWLGNASGGAVAYASACSACRSPKLALTARRLSQIKHRNMVSNIGSKHR